MMRRTVSQLKKHGEHVVEEFSTGYNQHYARVERDGKVVTLRVHKEKVK